MGILNSDIYIYEEHIGTITEYLQTTAVIVVTTVVVNIGWTFYSVCE